MAFGCIMPGSRPASKGLVLAALAAGLAAVPAGPARADRISLRGGGEIRGKLVDDPDHKGKLLLFQLKGRTPLSLRREQITATVPEPSPLDEYVARRAGPRDTADAEFRLGEWCDGNKLPDLAVAHYEAAVKLDHDFAPAHEKLGHTLHDGKWLDADGLREAKGMVRFGGKWMTAEERDRREAAAASSNEGRAWTRRVAKLADSYRRGPDAVSDVAEKTLLDLREPAAVPAVVQVLGQAREPEVRELAGRVLAAIPGPEATAGLAARVLAEADEPTRQATMAELSRREAADALPALGRGLRSDRVEVVNRAAWAIGMLNAKGMVPRLVPALVSVENQMVTVPVPNAAPVAAPGIFIGGGPSIPVLGPAVVGPGAVAFGAGSIPATALGGGFGVGLGGGPAVPQVENRVVSYERGNVEVLAALVKLTGRDFGYDVVAWQQWVRTSFRIDPPGPGPRRVPQP